MRAGWTRHAAVATVAFAAVFTLAGSAGSANQNTLEVQLFNYPGPSSVSNLRNVATTLRIRNISGNPWNTVVATIPVPTNTDGAKATLQKSICGAPVGQESDVVCNLGTLPPDPNATYTFLIIWKTWDSGTSSDCGSEPSPCFVTAANVTGSAGTVGSPGNKPPSKVKSFTPNPIVTPLLDTPGADKKSAGGYSLDACIAPDFVPNLHTNLQLDKDTNPLSTSVCSAELIADPFLNSSGLVAAITEFPKTDGPGKTEVSRICIPSPMDPSVAVGCDGAYTRYQFADYATFVLVVDNGSFNGQITKVFYDPDLTPTDTFQELPFSQPADGGPYVQLPILVDNQAKTTTIVVKSKHNGRITNG